MGLRFCKLRINLEWNSPSFLTSYEYGFCIEGEALVAFSFILPTHSSEWNCVLGFAWFIVEELGKLEEDGLLYFALTAWKTSKIKDLIAFGCKGNAYRFEDKGFVWFYDG